MNNHSHGAFAGHLLGARDLTPHTSNLSFTPSLDVSEDTSLRPPGDAKTFLQGLGGSAASSSGFAVNDPDFLNAEMAQLIGNSRDVEPATFAWFGAQIGTLVTLARARKTQFNVPLSNSSVITTSINHSCDGAYRLGTALFCPFGNATYAGAETQAIIFDAANVNQFFALRFTGQAQTFEFKADASNATLITGINGLLSAIPALSDVTATVTGSLTGTDTKSGTRQVAFTGVANIPQLEVFSGAVRRFQVAGGDGGNYSVDGGANFTLGITQTNFQVNQRAINAAHAGSVSIGSSTAPAAGSSIATGGAAFGNPGSSGTNSAFTNTSLASAAFESKSGNSTGILGYDRGSENGIVATSYFVQPFSEDADGPGATPKDFTFEGSNDNASWDVLDSKTNITDWPDQVKQTFAFSNSIAYRYYRINVTDNNGSAFGVVIRHFGILGVGVAGVADFTSYFPLAATPGAATKTGTGATNTVLLAPSALADTITTTNLTQGGTSSPRYNLISAPTTGEWHDNGAATSTGFTARFQAPFAVGSACIVTIEHADTTGGAVSTLCTFNSVTNPTNPALLAQDITGAMGASVKRYTRTKITTVNGTYAAFVGLSRYS